MEGNGIDWKEIEMGRKWSGMEGHGNGIVSKGRTCKRDSIKRKDREMG